MHHGALTSCGSRVDAGGQGRSCGQRSGGWRRGSQCRGAERGLTRGDKGLPGHCAIWLLRLPSHSVSPTLGLRQQDPAVRGSPASIRLLGKCSLPASASTPLRLCAGATATGLPGPRALLCKYENKSSRCYLTSLLIYRMALIISPKT